MKLKSSYKYFWKVATLFLFCIKCSYMAKTKQIGVRFDADLLKAFQEDKIADSPQKALNFLTEFYRENRPSKIDFSEKFKNLPLSTKNKTQIKDLTQPTNQIKPQEQPKTNYSINTVPEEKKP